LPVVPVYNYCTVNNMRFVAFLDTEEVAGSNPVVPTIFISNLERFVSIASTRDPTRDRSFPSFLRFVRRSVLLIALRNGP
jgi:hypothetical protein